VVTDGSGVQRLEIGVKLYAATTSWHVCDTSVLIDANGDGVAEQELVGTYLQTLTGNAANVEDFASALTDAAAMRKLRRDWELAPTATEPSYAPAVLDTQDYRAFDHSSVAILAADLSKVARTPTGDIRVRIATLADVGTPESDDFLGSKWLTITPTAAGAAFADLPETVVVQANEAKTVALTKGGSNGKLVAYLPYNPVLTAPTGHDAQSVILSPAFKP
jgi:hypothetical protein